MLLNIRAKVLQLKWKKNASWVISRLKLLYFIILFQLIMTMAVGYKDGKEACYVSFLPLVRTCCLRRSMNGMSLAVSTGWLSMGHADRRRWIQTWFKQSWIVGRLLQSKQSRQWRHVRRLWFDRTMCFMRYVCCTTAFRNHCIIPTYRIYQLISMTIVRMRVTPVSFQCIWSDPCTCSHYYKLKSKYE